MRRRREEEGGKPHHGRGRHPCRERRRRSSHSRFEWRHEHARGGYRGGQGGRGRDTHVRTKKLSASASISAKNAANWSRTAVGRRAGAGEGGGWEIGVEQGRVYRHRTWKERTDREGRFHVGKIPIPDSPKLNWTSRRGLGERERERACERGSEGRRSKKVLTFSSILSSLHSHSPSVSRASRSPSSAHFLFVFRSSLTARRGTRAAPLCRLLGLPAPPHRAS